MKKYSESSPCGFQPFCPSDDLSYVTKRFIYFQNLHEKDSSGTIYKNLLKELVPIGYQLAKTFFVEYLRFYLPSKATEKTHDYDPLKTKNTIHV